MGGGVFTVAVPSLLVLLSFNKFASGDSIDLSQYHRMPRLTEFDDYDRCLEEPPPDKVATYCLVRLVLKPDNRSELWQTIENFSSDRRHYNHRHLHRGVCVEDCKNLVKRLPNTTRQALRVKKFDIDYPYIFDVSVFKDTELNRARYAELVEVCMNHKLNETFQLKAYTEIEVCHRNDESIEIDWLDMLFVFVFVTLIVLVVWSSWYDNSINNNKKDVMHYHLELDTKRDKFFASFSILRNWYRLTSRSQDQLIKELRFIQAIRFLAMHLVILGHAALLYAVIPVQNTARAEMMYHNIGTMILTGGAQIPQSFFFISGMLLTLHVMSYFKNRNEKFGLLHLLKMTIYRYIRLTPVYGFIILLHGTWLAKLQDGPLWKLGSDTERGFCRRNWWTNLLYVNNYVNANQPCVQQGWYLGCDYQLFIAGTLLLMLINNYRRFMIPIVVVASIGGSYLLPAFFVYYQKLEGVFVVTLEAQRFVMWFEDFYLKSYIPFHMNIGNFIAGIVTGLIHIHIRQNNIDPVQKKWFRILWHLIVPMAIASFLVHYIFYVYDFEKPSLWMAAYFPVMKNSWGFLCSIFFIGFTHGIHPTLKRILDCRIFEPLGRMTYSAYLAHVFVMRLMLLSVRSPAHFSILGMMTINFASVIFSYLMAIFLCLTLEAPVAALQKLLIGNLKGETGQQQELLNKKLEGCIQDTTEHNNIKNGTFLGSS
ncbi:nose resistant to fluoxetine protein 6-like [Malaya genurostris]|uniref:nose resistant to fluoxetine protein 6-like n=1 Tax=Malaya genurostris TaxID=325434 RepID=UPI0026F3E20E|nr:nose resistant to fluoxetine protein 6-like [Malaya genurostris]